jgi:Mn-containing catalase
LGWDSRLVEVEHWNCKLLAMVLVLNLFRGLLNTGSQRNLVRVSYWHQRGERWWQRGKMTQRKQCQQKLHIKGNSAQSPNIKQAKDEMKEADWNLQKRMIIHQGRKDACFPS